MSFIGKTPSMDGLYLGPKSADPSPAVAGQIYYNSVSKTLRVYNGTSWISLVSNVDGVPVGTIQAYGGTSTPSGYLFCNGAEVSRTTYSALFTAIGTAWGEGDGSTTFNLPDLRYKFLRGYGPTNEKTGTGSASSNNATFTNHGFSIGQRIRKTSGTLSGLSNNVDYYVIVVDSNTIAFATTRANAFSNTKIAISGSNSAVISIWEDTDASDRQVNRAGGNSGANVGSVQADQFQSHEHLVNLNTGNNGMSHVSTVRFAPGNDVSGPVDNVSMVRTPANISGAGAVRHGAETRPQNAYVNYIIKAT